MNDSPGRFADPRGIVDAGSIELPDQDRLNGQADRGGVAIPWQVDQAGDEVAELIGPQEKPRVPSRRRVDDRLGDVEKLRRIQGEQFRARDGGEHVEEQLARAARVSRRHRQRLGHLLRHQRDVEHVGVHRRRGEQPHEAVLDVGLLPDHHDVGVGAVPQEAGHGGLRQHQHVLVVAELRQHLGAQPRHPEPAALHHGRRARPHATALRAQEHEMAVAQPAQQLRHRGRVRAGEPGSVVGGDRLGEAAQLGGQCRRVGRHRARVGHHHRQQPDGLVHRALIGIGSQPQMDPRFVHAVGSAALGSAALGSAAGRGHLEQGAVGVAADPKHRMHQPLVAHAQPVQEDRDRVHQHGGLIGDDLQGRPEASGVVGAVHPDQSLARAAAPRETFVRGDQRIWDRRARAAVRGAEGVPVAGFEHPCAAVNRHTWAP